MRLVKGADVSESIVGSLIGREVVQVLFARVGGTPLLSVKSNGEKGKEAHLWLRDPSPHQDRVDVSLLCKQHIGF